MKAIKQDFYDKNRQQLHEIIPLEMPFTVSIEVSSACDLRCKFCTLSSPGALNDIGHIMKNMSWETYSIIIKQLKEFPKPFKRIYFCGLGEVLVNPLLPDMVREIKLNNIAPETMIFTNAVNLTHEISLALIDAGLDIITISVNGLNSDDYERNCGRRIDYEKYVEQITFLYKNKKNLRINIKTVDQCIKTESDKEFFFNTFGNICDFINIERVASFHIDGDFTGESIKTPEHYSKFSTINVTRRVCSQPFYRLVISSLGKVNFCDAIYGFPFEDLDIRKQRLVDIWNGQIHKQFLLNQLKYENKDVTAMCKDCNGKHNLAFDEENLDPYAEELYERIFKEI